MGKHSYIIDFFVVIDLGDISTIAVGGLATLAVVLPRYSVAGNDNNFHIISQKKKAPLRSIS